MLDTSLVGYSFVQEKFGAESSCDCLDSFLNTAKTKTAKVATGMYDGTHTTLAQARLLGPSSSVNSTASWFTLGLWRMGLCSHPSLVSHHIRRVSWWLFVQQFRLQKLWLLYLQASPVLSSLLAETIASKIFGTYLYVITSYRNRVLSYFWKYRLFVNKQSNEFPLWELSVGYAIFSKVYVGPWDPTDRKTCII